MTSLTADDNMLRILSQVNELAEIRDASGRVIGFFAPVSVERADLYAQAAAQVDPTEIQRRKEPGRKTHTTQEVLDHLKSLEKS